MLAKRITACLTVQDGIVVQSIGFRRYLPVGSLSVAVEFLSQWGIDEIAILDISEDRRRRGPDFALLEKAARRCFTPLAVGGGIRGLEDMRMLNALGAEKCVLNTLAVEAPERITEAAAIFGSQFVVVSIDAKRTHAGCEVYSHGGTRPTGLTPEECARRVEKRGAGEILLNSIDRDGSKRGFDIPLINAVASVVRIPVIAVGGAGTADHFHETLRKTQASAVGAGNFFHFTEHSPIVLKAYLKSRHMPVRLETYATYEGVSFDAAGRLLKRPEAYLDKLRFTYLPEEVI